MEESVRARLVAARRSKGWTQEELAEAASVTVRTIQRLESGETVPRLHTLRSVATILDLPLESVIKENDPKVAKSVSDQIYDDSAKQYYLRLVNLSAFSYLIVPLVHFLIPFYLLRKGHILNHQHRRLGRQIVSTQIWWTISLHVSLLVTLAYNLLQANYSTKPVLVSYYIPFLSMYLINAILILRLQMHIRDAEKQAFSEMT